MPPCSHTIIALVAELETAVRYSTRMGELSPHLTPSSLLWLDNHSRLEQRATAFVMRYIEPAAVRRKRARTYPNTLRGFNACIA
jgi:hypothetical protein